MFYDERIENAKGKISRGAVWLSMIITFVLGGIHLVNIIRNAPENKYFWFVVLDGAIVIACLIVVLVDFAMGKLQMKDERALAERSVFYNRTVMILLKFIFGVFAIVKPIALYIEKSFANFSDYGFEAILYVLLFIVVIYIVCSFRRQDIYFNYSIIESECYCKSVFKNIGRFGFYVLLYFGISVISLAGLVALKMPESECIVRIFLDMTTYYVVIFIEVALLYLLYSFLEKSSYHNENSMSFSTAVSLSIAIFLYAVYTAGVILIDLLPISQSNALQFVSLLVPINPYIRLALLIFLTYFGYEYQRVYNNKLLSAACLAIVFSEVLVLFFGQIINHLTFVFMPELMAQDSYIVNLILSAISTFLEVASYLANAVGFVLLIFALVKDQMIAKANYFVIFVFILFGGGEVFLRTQVDFLSVRIYHFVAEIMILSYFLLVLIFVIKKSKEKLLVIAEKGENI